MVKVQPIAAQIRTPEQFEDWNSFSGYSNLVDFEIDAGHLAKAIVLFSESEGAIAELGSFCTDPILADRFFVVIAREHYEAPSFIANGPIKKIELGHEHSVCVLDTLDTSKLEKQLPDLSAALKEKLSTLPKTLAFQPSLHRDQFLLVADLVDLFGALTRKELYELIHEMGVDTDYARLDRITNQLFRFDLISFIPGTTKRFFVAPKNRLSYLNYASPHDTAPFDRVRFKLMIASPWLKSDPARSKAYEEIHPRGQDERH